MVVNKDDSVGGGDGVQGANKDNLNGSGGAVVSDNGTKNDAVADTTPNEGVAAAINNTGTAVSRTKVTRARSPLAEEMADRHRSLARTEHHQDLERNRTPSGPQVSRWACDTNQENPQASPLSSIDDVVFHGQWADDVLYPLDRIDDARSISSEGWTLPKLDWPKAFNQEAYQEKTKKMDCPHCAVNNHFVNGRYSEQCPSYSWALSHGCTSHYNPTAKTTDYYRKGLKITREPIWFAGHFGMQATEVYWLFAEFACRFRDDKNRAEDAKGYWLNNDSSDRGISKEVYELANKCWGHLEDAQLFAVAGINMFRAPKIRESVAGPSDGGAGGNRAAALQGKGVPIQAGLYEGMMSSPCRSRHRI